MLEIATAAPAYKDLMAALGKLAAWAEDAGKSALPSGTPPADVVRQFNEALHAMPVETSPGVTVVEPAQRVGGNGVVEATPCEIIGDADMFRVDTSLPLSETAEKKGVANFEEQRRQTSPMNDAQEINMDLGLDALQNAANTHHSDFLTTARDLSDILAKPAGELSPLDLVQAQRLVGMLKVQAETGQKTSEGVSDSLEQLLDVEG